MAIKITARASSRNRISADDPDPASSHPPCGGATPAAPSPLVSHWTNSRPRFEQTQEGAHNPTVVQQPELQSEPVEHGAEQLQLSPPQLATVSCQPGMHVP
jgi:hypothetical protein